MKLVKLISHAAHSFTRRRKAHLSHHPLHLFGCDNLCLLHGPVQGISKEGGDAFAGDIFADVDADDFLLRVYDDFHAFGFRLDVDVPKFLLDLLCLPLETEHIPGLRE